MAVLFNKEDYKTRFDNDYYVAKYYSDVNGFLEGSLRTLHEIFLSGDHTGTKLLDVGTGPSIHTVISASRIFSEIYLSDLSEKNRQVLETWRKKIPMAHKWTNVLEYISKLEGITSEELEERTRSSIKGVLPCDVLADDIVPQDYNQFDCIVSSACLESACPDLGSFKASIGKFAGLMKPGGTVVLFCFFGDGWYRVRNEIFRSYNYTKTDYKEAFANAGLVNLRFKHEYLFTDEEKAKFAADFQGVDGYFLLSAKRPNSHNA